MEILATSLWRAGHAVEALGVLEQNLVDIREKGSSSQALSYTLLALSQVLQSMNQLEEAADYSCRAWDAIGEDPNLPAGLTARARYGDVLIDLNRFAEAESVLLQCFHDLGDITNPVRDLTTQFLVKLYQNWGRPEEVKRYMPSGPIEN